MKPAGNAVNEGKWNCPQGCNQAESLKRRGGPCVHLERLLNPMQVSGGSSRLIFTEMLDKWEKNRVPLYEGDESTDEAKLRSKLAIYQLHERKVEVVIDRLVRGKTFKEIAIDQGYAEASAAKRAYEDALKQLKKRGYE